MKLSKNQRKLICVLLALSLVMSMMIAIPASAARSKPKTAQIGVYTYRYQINEDGTAVLTQVMSAGRATYDEVIPGNGDLTLPTEIDGHQITEVEDRCFSAIRLNSLTIPEGITNLNNAFLYCYGIHEINIPASVTEIGDWAFAYSTPDMAINVSSGNTALKMENGFLTRTEDKAVLVYKGKEDKVTVPSDIEKIESFAFSANKNIKEVVVPDTVTDIEYAAFISAINLKDVRLPANLKSVKRLTFENCDSLEGIDLPQTISEIGDNAFTYCHGLKEIDIPASVKIIGMGAFDECSSLEKVTFSEGLEEVYREAFYGCSSLKDVTLPASLKTISPYAFGFVFNEDWWREDDPDDWYEAACNADLAETGEGYVFDEEDLEWQREQEEWQKQQAEWREKFQAYQESWRKDYTEGDYEIPSNYRISDGFKIYGTVDSEAQKYAGIYSIPFVGIAGEAPAADIDGDKEVTIMDATCLQREMAEMKVNVYILIVADVDSDGDITIMDATRVQRFLAELCELDGSPFKG